MSRLLVPIHEKLIDALSSSHESLSEVTSDFNEFVGLRANRAQLELDRRSGAISEKDAIRAIIRQNTLDNMPGRKDLAFTESEKKKWDGYIEVRPLWNDDRGGVLTGTVCDQPFDPCADDQGDDSLSSLSSDELCL
jgi:hypothetical protein